MSYFDAFDQRFCHDADESSASYDLPQIAQYVGQGCGVETNPSYFEVDGECQLISFSGNTYYQWLLVEGTSTDFENPCGKYFLIVVFMFSSQ